MEDPSDDEKECYLPPMPEKPQKTLFSYFNKNAPDKNTKSVAPLKKKPDSCKQKKVKVKSNENSRNSGISVAIFGQNAAKKISKKSPKVNGLDKFLTEIDSDENDDNVSSDHEMGNEDINTNSNDGRTNEIDTSIAGDACSTEISSGVKENDIQSKHNEQNEPNLMECDEIDSTHQDVGSVNDELSGLPLAKDQILEKENPQEKELQKNVEESTTVTFTEEKEIPKIKYTTVKLNCTGSKKNLDCSEDKSASTSVRGRKKKEVKVNVSSNQDMNEDASSQSEKESVSSPCSTKKKGRAKKTKTKSPSKSPSPRKKLVDKKSIIKSGLDGCISEDGLETEANDSPNKMMKRLSKKQTFESSDEDEVVDVISIEKHDPTGDTDKLKVQPISSSIPKDISQNPMSYDKSELMEGITPLNNSSPMKTVDGLKNKDNPLETIKITADRLCPKKEKLVGSIYPTKTDSKYKEFLSMNTNVIVEEQKELVFKPVESFVKVLQEEYPGIAIKKMFLQLLECQKNTITKNLTKVESSKKVLETLWERDSQLQSEEMALAEELKRKEEEMALAELKKKMRNDIRTSFARTKKRKKKVVEPLDDEDVDIVESNKESCSAKKGSKTPTDKNVEEVKEKSTKKKSKNDKTEVTESMNVEKESQKETTNDIISSFKRSKGKKDNENLVSTENNESLKTKEQKKSKRSVEDKKILADTDTEVIKDDDEVQNISASGKKGKNKKNNKLTTSKVENDGKDIKSKVDSEKKSKRKSIRDMFGSVKEDTIIPSTEDPIANSKSKDSENDKFVEIIDEDKNETKKPRRKSKNQSIKEMMSGEKINEKSPNNEVVSETNEIKTIEKSKSTAKKGKKAQQSKGKTDLIKIPSTIEILKDEEEENLIKIKSPKTSSPLEEVTVLDNSQNIDKSEVVGVEKSNRRRSARSCNIVVNYSDTKVSGENGEQVKLDSVLLEAMVENIDEEVEIKTEGDHEENASDENVKPRKRKLSRSGSASKKKLKLSSEKPVTRRRSSRKSIDFFSHESEREDVDVKTEDNQVENMETSEVDELKSKKEESGEDTTTLRRSSRVRKPVVAFVPNDHDDSMNDFEENTKDRSEKKKDKQIEVEDNESDDSIILTSSQEKPENVLLHKSTLSRAIETLDLLEQSPRRSPKKPIIDIKLDETYVNGYLSWTEKYQPAKARYVIGDKSNVRKLFDWLLLWKERHESTVRKIAQHEVKSRRKSNYTDSDSESEESEIEDYLPNTIILTGPSGCGTTTAVYACAKQLDFKVLELNPSVNRTGKQIFDRVSEAVVSHQVNKLSDNSEGNTQNDTAKKENFFMPKKEKIVPKKEALSKPNSDTNKSSTGVKAMSLVLFEQVDIVYDEIDRGFYQGITDLRGLAKRPIILTANNSAVYDKVFGVDEWVDHIPLTYPSVEKALPMLQLMCLVEYVFIPKQILSDLIRTCKNDIRRTILHLMFWFSQGKQPLFLKWEVKHNKSKSKEPNTLDMENCDPDQNNVRSSLFDSEDNNISAMEITNDVLPDHSGESSINFQQIINDGKCNSSSLHSNYSFSKNKLTNSYSSIDHIAETADSISELNSYLSLDRNKFEGDQYKWTSTLTDSLSDTFSKEKNDLFTYPMSAVCNDVKNVSFQNYQQLFSDQINANEQSNISYSDMYNSLLNANTVKYHINRKPFHSDVLPYVSKICHIEDMKLSSIHHRKRGNRRYMHYLQSVGINLEESALKELSKPLL